MCDTRQLAACADSSCCRLCSVQATRGMRADFYSYPETMKLTVPNKHISKALSFHVSLRPKRLTSHSVAASKISARTAWDCGPIRR